MKLTSEQKTLFQLLRGKLEELPDDFDPVSFMRLLQRHKLLPLAEGMLELVDPETRADWKQRLHSWVFRSVNVFEALKSVNQSLEAANIDVTCFKGPMLSYLLYDNPHARFYSDLDIIVPPPKLEEAVQILAGQGCRLIRPAGDPATFDWGRYFRDVNDVGLFRDDQRIYLELHRGIYKPGLLEAEMEKSILEETQILQIKGSKFRIPAPEAYFLYLCYHGAAHMYFRLTWLRDVARYLETVAFDHTVFLQLVYRLNMEKLTGISLLLARHYFKTTIPSELEILTRSKGLRTLVWLAHQAILGPGRASLTKSILVLKGRRNRVRGIDRAGVCHWAIRLIYAILLRQNRTARRDVLKRMMYKWRLSKG